MAYKDREHFPVGINMYVPAMQYASEVATSQPVAFNLGTPAAKSASVIAAATPSNSAVGTQVAYTWVSDSRYGRTIQLTPSANPGAVGGAIDVFGTDYLGQPMVERFSGANGATAILYGKKAFYRVTHSKIVTASTNATTYAIGTGDRLGLPFKGGIAWASEGGVQVAVSGGKEVTLYTDRSRTEAAAGTSKWITAPFAGYIKSITGTPDGGGGAVDPVITVRINGVAVTGLTITVDTSDVAGLTVTDTPTTPGYSANNRFAAGDRIEIVGTAAAGAFGDRIGLTLVSLQGSAGDLTDPQTNTSSDPRGLYEPLTIPNGSLNYQVGLIGDSSLNAAGNGGLHGLKQAAA